MSGNKYSYVDDKTTTENLATASQNLFEEGKILEACIITVASILVQTNIRLSWIADELSAMRKEK